MKLDLEDGEKPLPRQSPRLSAERVVRCLGLLLFSRTTLRPIAAERS